MPYCPVRFRYVHGVQENLGGYGTGSMPDCHAAPVQQEGCVHGVQETGGAALGYV